MHLHLLDFPEQVGCEDEVVEGFVVGGDDLVFCSLPFFNTFFDEDDVFPDIHYGVHVMGVDNRGHLIFRCNIVDQVVYQQGRFRVQSGSSQKRYLGFNAIARAIAARFIIPPLISDGYRCSASERFTRSRQNMALFSLSL